VPSRPSDRVRGAAITLATLLSTIEQRLARAGVDAPRNDAELLAAHVLGVSRSELATRRSLPVGEAAEGELVELVERRERREPLQYVLGEWGFRRLVLNVDPRALVPRPETEVLVERALALLAGREHPAVLDVGTGSGAVALAIADEHPGARVVGLDSSVGALELARENAERCGLALELVHGDLFDRLPTGPWQLVVSNPPYVPLADRDALPPEVRDWEPASALHATGALEAVARHAWDVLDENGAVALEFGDGQAGEATSILTSLGFRGVRVTRDLAGRERIVEATR
jgi:release factor glutamine methyltransferase